MLTSTAGLVSAVTIVYTGFTEGLTVATSWMRTGTPSLVDLTTMFAISSGVWTCALTNAMYSW